jgi:tetratricopeptide (TPR) repeat protein
MNKSGVWKRLITCLLVATSLTGCFGGKPAIIRSENLQRAETALTRGVRAEQKGNYQESISQLSEALSISTSIEDLPLRITSLVNLARLHRLNHELQRSEQYGNQALGLLSPDSHLYSEACHEKALLELAKQQPAQALIWGERAMAAESGDQYGSRLNLASRINLEMGNRSVADGVARQALAKNRSAGQAEEEANSLRILGIVARLEKNYGEAEHLLVEALSIDKRLGRSGKIAIDLEELALISQSSGNLKLSLHYLERAGDVHDAAGRKQLAIKLLERRAEIHTLLGESGKADEIRENAHKRASQNSSPTISPSSRP